MSNIHFKIADNSGVEKVLLLSNLTRKKKYPKLGDLVVGVVKQVGTYSSLTLSTIIYAVVVRVKISSYMKGKIVKFNDSSLVLVDKNLAPLSSRIFGTLPIILKDKGCLKLNSITVDFV